MRKSSKKNIKKEMREFVENAKNILTKKGYKETSYAFDELLEVIRNNSINAVGKTKFYKGLGMFLLTSIPLISALLSVAVGLKVGGSTLFEKFIIMISLPMSLFLSLGTILNSIFRPSERFQNACMVGIKISAFKISFLAELEKIDKIDNDGLYNFVTEQREKFKKYQIELVGLFMPMESPDK